MKVALDNILLWIIDIITTFDNREGGDKLQSLRKHIFSWHQFKMRAIHYLEILH